MWLSWNYVTFCDVLNETKQNKKREQILENEQYLLEIILKSGILVPRFRASFGQNQESRPLRWSNNGSPRFTDFP